jgi:chitinase
VTVSVNGDTAAEGNETLFLNLSNPKGLQMADNQAVGTIVDDDGVTPAPPVPAVSVGDGWVVEGNSGQTAETFIVSLSQPSTSTVAVTASTAPATATANIDFENYFPTTVTFSPGEVSKTVTVQVIGDTTKEAVENYSVKLSAPTGATLGDPVGVGRIADDD